MSGALKVVGVVLGAVAVVATAGAALGVAMGGTMMLSGVASAATIASIAGGAAAVVSSISQAIAKPPSARGSVSQIVIAADAPQPYVMGEGYTAGVLRHRTAYGGKVDKVHNPYLFDAIVYSGGGPVQSIAPRVDGAAIGMYYSGWLYTTSQLGLCPQPTALTPQWPGATGWGASHKLSGQAAIGWSFQFDKEGKVFASGLPQTGAYGQWVKVYDPRLDSTQPGGSGSHRLGNEATYGYSDNPALHAATYAYGRFQNGKRVIGMGLPADAIDWQVVAAWANTCQLNNWRLFGVVYEPADRWANLVDICAAGGAEPIPGAILSFRYQAPRVALDTITESDIAEEDCTVCAMQSYRDRVNIVIPKRIFPNANWELMSDAEVAVAAYIDDDGEERPREWPFNFVKDSKQARELAAYKLVDTRELFPIELTCIPRLRGYRPGDCLHLSLPQLGLDHDAIILHREFDPATLKVKLTLISETAGKHAFALGQSSAAPPTASLSPNGAERDETAWRPPAWTDIIDDDPLHPKPEDGATVGAPSGTDIGGVPVDQWLLDMAQLQTDMNTAEGVITDLLDAYGPTANAGASAAAALNAKLAAEQALADALEAEEGAQTQAGIAVSAAGDAEDAATAANNSASAASASAGTAGSHASTATTQAGIATTKAGEASTYAGNSASSAATAEGHKNSASASAILSASASNGAIAAASALMPAVIGAEWFTTRAHFGSPTDAPLLPASSVVNGVCTIDATNSSRALAPRQPIAWVEGSVYEVTVDVEGAGAAQWLYPYAGRMNATYANVAEHVINVKKTALAVAERKVVTFRISCGTVAGSGADVALPAASWFRPALVTCRSETAYGTIIAGASAIVRSFQIRDITAQVAAANSASAANNSASSASASASTAGSHASTASSQAGIATTKAGEASTFSSNAASSAATAEGHANAASMSAGVAASMGQGALNKNAGFDTYPSATVGAFPTGWTAWVGANHYRTPDPQGGYAVRIPAAGGADAGIQQNLSSEQLLTQDGYYVLEADVVLRAGTFAGAGMLLVALSQFDVGLLSLPLHFNLDPDVTGTVQSAPVVGRAYSFRKLVKVAAADPKGFFLYACTKYSGLNGGNAAAGDIEWRKCMVRPATQAEIRDQTALAPLEATVSSHTSAIATVNSTLATQNTTLTAQGITIGEHAFALTTLEDDLEIVAARWGIQIDVNGRIIGRVKLDGSASSSLFEVMSSVFRVVNPGGGAALTWGDGVLWNKGSSHSVILGQNFGTSANLLFWAGPNPASPSAASKANGVFWIDNAGNAYFGGSLSAGVLKNSAQTTLATVDAELIVGPFSTNGASKSITVSHSFTDARTTSGNGGTGSQPMTATIQVHRSIGNGAWVLVDTLSVTGTYNYTYQAAIGSTSHVYQMNGSKTFNDLSAATSNIRFRAKLTALAVNGVAQTTLSSTAAQTISLISVEA